MREGEEHSMDSCLAACLCVFIGFFCEQTDKLILIDLSSLLKCSKSKEGEIKSLPEKFYKRSAVLKPGRLPWRGNAATMGLLWRKPPS